jgi:predicted short-subunit dehydrogenase-like oxidoreductase (DUF2520 family)
MLGSPIVNRFGIIGNGRVSRALALGLGPHSAARPLMWARDPGKGIQAADGICEVAADIAALIAACDIVAITVSDDAIAPIVASIVAIGALPHAAFVFHVSGASGTGILQPLETIGALTAAIHPAMTFTGDAPLEVQRMAGTRFAITGSSDEATQQARTLVEALGGVTVEIAEEHRTLYHAGLCHASNHLVTLLAGAAQALGTVGVADPMALLAPLVRAAMENGLDWGMDALSGPLLRGDAQTIQRHVGAIARDAPALLPAYRAMAQATLDELDRRAGTAKRSDIRHALTYAGSPPE